MSGREPPRAQPPLRLALAILLPFALGYYLSFLFRSLNAVIAPRLVAELDFDAATLGLLTASYFVTFAAFQIPLGILLDRYGPRRVQSALLLCTMAGAMLFALGRDGPSLIVARGLIGLGVSGALMSAMTAIVQWFPRERVPLVNAAFLLAGCFGMLSATRPLEWLLTLADWRTVFLLLTGMTAAAAAIIFGVVPDRHGAGATAGVRQQIGQLGRIYGDAGFWRVAPACGLQIGAVFSVLGLWAAYWLTDVERLPRAAVVDALFAMAISFTVGTIAIGFLADWLVRRRVPLERVLGVGLIMFIAVEAAIVLQIAASAYWLFVAYAFFGNLTALAFALIPRRVPEAFAGRALTALNIVSLVAAFLIQWLMGVVVSLWPRGADGTYPTAAYEAAFGFVLVLHAVSTAYLMMAGKRRSEAQTV